jgi:hypothetical protein
MKLPRLDNLMLIHKILGIDALGELVEQISLGHRIKIGKINASLEWMDGKLDYDFKMRAYAKQEYHVDEACHIIFKSGKYNEVLDRIVRPLKPLAWQGHTYRDLRDVLKSLLDVEFGTLAFSPFVRILAPIYVKIEESKPEISKIEVLLSSALEANLSKIKLLIFGEDENSKHTKLREQITTFTRKEDSELMEPIVVTVDEQSRYAKLSFYYGDDLREDYYIRVPKLVIRELTDIVGVPGTSIDREEKIRKVKQEIKIKYTKAKDKNNTSDVKGKMLEEVIKGIIEMVPGLKVEGSRVTNEIQEIDIVVRNFNKTNVWADFESVFFVECKNWFKKRKPGADKIRDFGGKLENKNLKTGIFVAPNGVVEGRGDCKIRGTNGQIDKYFHRGVKIIVLEDNDILEILL